MKFRAGFIVIASLSLQIFGSIERPAQAQASSELTRADRAQIVKELSRNIDSDYVNPDVAAKMVSALRQHQNAGDYDAITQGPSFAAKLTADLRAISHDGHLSVDYLPEAIPEHPVDEPTPEELEQFRIAGKRRNFEFRKVEELSGSVGLLEIDGFYPAEFVREPLTGAISFLANSEAIILDLRHNGGGAPDGVLALESYFFKDATHITDQYVRATKELHQYWTSPTLTGPSLADKKLYILISHDTFSAPEDLAYNLQALGRATIIGETSGGGAHGTKPYRISAHFMASIPFNDSINPVTHGNWEGRGVIPDVRVPADQALIKAHILALQSVLQRSGSDPNRSKQLQDSIHQEELALKSMDSKSQ